MRQPVGARREVSFLVVLTVFLAGVTWQKSGDLFIDWGRELYSAMSVARGLGIPEDVQLLFGSLSPLLNGAVLYLAGEQIASILLLNLSILAAASALAWWIAATVFGRSAAFMVTLVWLLLSAFPHLVRVGNYNFLTPYSHGITHGLTAGLLCTACVLQALRRKDAGWWIGAGFACGLALFAKPEAGFATAATLLTGLTLGHLAGQKRLDQSIPASLAGLGVAFGIVVSAARLAGGISAVEHLDPYLSAIRAFNMELPFYGGGTFGRSPAATLLYGGSLFFAIVAVALFAEHRDLRFDGPSGDSLIGRWRIASVAIAVLAVMVCALLAPFAWHGLAATLPWACATVLISSIYSLAASAGGSGGDERLTAACRAVLAVFATGWLLKIGTAPRFDHYGFALAAPALILGIGSLTGDRAIGWDRSPHTMIRRRAVGSALALYLAISAASQSAAFYAKRTTAVGTAANRTLVFNSDFDPRTPLFQEILQELDSSSSFREGAVILPEGGLLHFLLQEPSAIRVASLMPLEVLMLSSERVLEMISGSGPAMMVVVDPGLQEWSRSENRAIQPYTEVLEAVESSCDLTRESGTLTTGADRVSVRFYSHCPGFAGNAIPESPSLEANPLPRSSDP
jgi:hypothetical protein